MLKTDYYPWTLHRSLKGANTYAGSWSSNSDYSKLVITLPNTPSNFVFKQGVALLLKAFPQLELAPWGTTEPLVLHMLQQ